MHAAGAVVDVRQHQNGEPLVEVRGDLVLVHQDQLEAVRARQRVGDVEVGGKVVRSETIRRRAGRVGVDHRHRGAQAPCRD